MPQLREKIKVNTIRIIGFSIENVTNILESFKRQNSPLAFENIELLKRHVIMFLITMILTPGFRFLVSFHLKFYLI